MRDTYVPTPTAGKRTSAPWYAFDDGDGYRWEPTGALCSIEPSSVWPCRMHGCAGCDADHYVGTHAKRD